MSFLNPKMLMLLGCLTAPYAAAADAEQLSSALSEQPLQLKIQQGVAMAASDTERYQWAKANAWLSYADHEASERGWTAAGKEAFAEAERLARAPESTNLSTHIISVSQVMRRDLWWQIEYLKQQGAVTAEPQALANAEVMLVWAAAEYCELGWRHAREHFSAAERQLQKVLYALPQAQDGMVWDEEQVPALSMLNGAGCKGVNPDVWPLVTALKKEEAAPATIENVVHFAVDRSDLTAESRLILDRIAALLAEYPDINLTLMGYTDTRASDAYNLALSQRRIDTVRSYLIQQGAAPERIAEQAKGKSGPIDDPQTAVAHAKSRRVVIIFNEIENKPVTVQPQWRDLQPER